MKSETNTRGQNNYKTQNSIYQVYIRNIIKLFSFFALHLNLSFKLCSGAWTTEKCEEELN